MVLTFAGFDTKTDTILLLENQFSTRTFKAQCSQEKWARLNHSPKKSTVTPGNKWTLSLRQSSESSFSHFKRPQWWRSQQNSFSCWADTRNKSSVVCNSHPVDSKPGPWSCPAEVFSVIFSGVTYDSSSSLKVRGKYELGAFFLQSKMEWSDVRAGSPAPCSPRGPVELQQSYFCSLRLGSSHSRRLCLAFYIHHVPGQSQCHLSWGMQAMGSCHISTLRKCVYYTYQKYTRKRGRTSLYDQLWCPESSSSSSPPLSV